MELNELNLNEEQMSGVQKIIQSKEDKLRTEYTKQIKDLKAKLPVEKSETEIELESRLKALEDKEKALKEQEQQAKLNKSLEEKGLNPQLSNYLNMNGVEDLGTYLDELFNIVVGEEKKNTYKPSNHNSTNGGVTKEEFDKMGYKERLDLYNSDRDLYNSLSK
ncbi:hypothetical protein [Clostridium butyricum]|uniref:hypothetical protein n=1 Tax=Clostridium butyricum TaxID=1492 RepID=UPI0018AC26B0|nr:hypothetical protein [Clostridium butyricum]